MQHCPEPGGPARRSATTRRDHRPPRRRRACRRRASGPRQTSSTTDLRLAPDAPSQHHVSTVDAALRVPRIGERGTCAAVHTGAGGLGTSRPRRGASTARGNGASAATGNGAVGNSRRHAIGVRSLSRENRVSVSSASSGLPQKISKTPPAGVTEPARCVASPKRPTAVDLRRGGAMRALKSC